MNVGRIGVAAACLAISGCSLFEGDRQVTLSVADAPIDELEQVVVQISRVTFISDDDERESFTFSPPVAVNLLEFTGGDRKELVSAEELPEGRYRRIEFRIDTDPSTDDSYFVRTGGEGDQEPLDIPDEFESQLTVSTDFTIDADSDDIDVIVDFDLRRSLFRTDDNAFELRPRLRAVLDAKAGSVSGTVAGNLQDGCAAPAVYAFSGSDVTPDDIDGLQAEPISSATVDVTDGSYAIGFLEAGSYTLAYTCDGGDDEPDEDNEDDVEFTREVDVSIVAERATTQNFN